jgi:methionine-rich copper-binding protein CopC
MDIMKTKKYSLKQVIILRISVIFISTFLVLSIVTPAWAHNVQPTKSDPADGAALAKSPDKITVWFGEEIVVDPSTLKVFNTQGTQVDLGSGGVDLTDASHMVMIVSVPALQEGVYIVKWHVGLTDGDFADGSFNFGVGNVTVPTSIPPTPDPVSTSVPSQTSSQMNYPVVIVGVAVLAIALVVVFRTR